MLTLAKQLSVARTLAAKRLQCRISAELTALSMSSARLEVALSPFESGQGTASESAARLGVDGGDEVELLFAAGDGMALRPLARAASGGELSRVVLALEVVLAAGLGPTSMVFDEVDAGIAGWRCSDRPGRSFASRTFRKSRRSPTGICWWPNPVAEPLFTVASSHLISRSGSANCHGCWRGLPTVSWLAVTRPNCWRPAQVWHQQARWFRQRGQGRPALDPRSQATGR
jgi:hypothetical protein